MQTLKNFQIVLFLAMFITGCIPASLPQRTSPNNYFAPQNIKSADFAKEISALTETSTNKITSAVERAEAHRRLAILYLIPRNPDSDFKTATKELGKYLEMAPDKLDNRAAANWATALKSGKEHQGLKRKVAALNKKVRLLSNEKKDLTSTNAELKQTIEKLKKLDLSLEKKRRKLR